MTCPRCEGLMVRDHLFDVENPTPELWVRAWRCINCGEILEGMIECHRRAGCRADPPAAASRAA